MTRIHLVGALLTVVALCGCGEDASESSGNGSAGGTVTDAWAEFCIGTFTESQEVDNVFGGPLFTAASGDAYLMANYGTFLDEVRVEMLYLSDAGPVDFEVEPDAAGDLPFTSNCELNQGQYHIGVFRDTTFYVDEALTIEACTLADGTHASGGGGFALVSDLDFNDPNQESVYQVTMGGLAEFCDGHADTFIAVRFTSIFGKNSTLVPVQTFIGP